MNERKSRAKKGIKPKIDYISNIRMFFGIDTARGYVEILNIFDISQLMKPKTTNFFLIGTLKTGTSIKKASMSFKDV